MWGTGSMEQGTRADGPGGRLLRLWLWSTPLVMLAIAVLFGVLAAGDEKWGVVAGMVALAVAAVALFAAQWLLLRRMAQQFRPPRKDT